MESQFETDMRKSMADVIGSVKMLSERLDTIEERLDQHDKIHVNVVIQDSFAKWAERQRDYQAAGACERAVGDMLAWLAAAYPSVECKRSGMYLVVVDKESKKVRDDGVALFKYPKDSMTPASARLHVAEMYTLDSSQGVWQFDREATRENLNRKVKGYAHTVAAIGQSIFLDWGWNQFLMPERFELRLAADVKETDRHPSAAQHAPAFAVADNPTL